MSSLAAGPSAAGGAGALPVPAVSPTTPSSSAFHSTAGHFLFTCRACTKAIQVDVDRPIPDAAIRAFNSAFHQAAPSAADQLSESFVVLPASKLASTFAPPTAGSAAAGPGAMGAPVTGTSLASTLAGKPVGGVAAVPAIGTTNYDKHVQAATKVLDIVQAQCPVSAPLCTHCSNAVMTELDRRIVEMDHDREEYARCLKTLQTPAAPANELGQSAAAEKQQQERAEADALDEEEKELARMEVELEGKLLGLRQEKSALHLEYALLDHESSKLSEYEAAFWREYEEYALQLAQVTEDQAYIKSQIKCAGDALDRMKRTNVFDDAFHISHDGHFPTINGFRLGRLPSQPIEWAETSAALGQVVLLLHTLARHTGYKFQKYRLVAMGSYSKMARLDDPATTYELYGSNDLILGRLFWYRRFDTALVWLLACIHEFGEYATSLDARCQLKYPIRGDCIGDVSIKLQFNNDAKWTKALKYTLTNCKQLLAWTSTRKQA